jgi:hypothetical protein
MKKSPLSNIVAMLRTIAGMTANTPSHSYNQATETYYKKGNSYWYKHGNHKPVQISKSVYNANKE